MKKVEKEDSLKTKCKPKRNKQMWKQQKFRLCQRLGQKDFFIGIVAWWVLYQKCDKVSYILYFRETIFH